MDLILATGRINGEAIRPGDLEERQVKANLTECFISVTARAVGVHRYRRFHSAVDPTSAFRGAFEDGEARG